MKKFQGGGGVPRQTTIGGQRHDLAYINPFEADLLRAYGGSGEPGPGGVPAYFSYSMSRNSDGSYSMPSSSQQQAQRAAAGAPSVSPSSSSSSSSTPTPTRTTPSRAAQDARIARAAQDAREARVRAVAATTPSRPSSGQDNNPNRPSPAEQVASAPDSGNVTSVYQGPRPSGRPSGAGPDPFDRPVPMGGLGDLTNLLGMIPGVPMLIDAAKGAAGDIQMSYYAGGPLRSREEQRRNLQEARNPDGSRMYSDFEIDEYFLVTDETAERARQQGGGARPAGDDSMPYTLPAAADPCPEGYRMDTVTNACVPADDVTGGTPPPVVPGFPDLTRPEPVAVPTVVGSSDYTQMPVTGGVPPLLPGTGALPMPDFSRGFMPTTYGGMPTDIDPFR
jgi:hypothetical protein